jgi:hypothetical protein
MIRRWAVGDKKPSKDRAKSTKKKERGPMTPASSPVYPDHPLGPAGRNEEDRLDEALDESFPTSDPPATRIE